MKKFQERSKLNLSEVNNEVLAQWNAEDVFHKRKLKVDLKVDYPAMIIPDDFIVGYGLDYNEAGRQLRDVYTLCK